MSVSDGELANEGTFNGAFLSKDIDGTTVGKIGLANVDPISGAAIVNVQKNLNALYSLLGMSSNQNYNALMAWATAAFGGNSTSVKTRVDNMAAALSLAQLMDEANNNTAVGSNYDLPTPATTVVRLTGGLVSLRSIVAPTSVRALILLNDTGGTYQILDEDAGAVAANRIRTGVVRNLDVEPTASIHLIYSLAAARWCVVGGSGSGGGGFNKIVTKTASATLNRDEDCILVTPAANMTLTLPVGVKKEQHNFLRTDAVESRTVEVVCSGADQILSPLGLVTSMTLPYQGSNLKLVYVDTNLWGIF